MDQYQKDQLFSEIYTDCKDKIRRICYGYIYEKEQVEDLFQEVLINIWNSLDRFRGDSKIGTWVYKVTVNTALMYNKRTKFYRHMHHSVYELNVNAADNDFNEDKSKEQKLEMLAQSISKLPKDDRLIITLILEDLSYEQVSEIMGITPNHVGVKVNRIKRKLLSIINIMNYERI